jgi:hypothetical protein
MKKNCGRCNKAFPSTGGDVICPTCQEIITVMGLKFPLTSKQNSKEKIVCPDCKGRKTRYHEPAETCCGGGCCYRPCASCNGRGFIKK